MKVYIYNEMELLWPTNSSFITFSFIFFLFLFSFSAILQHSRKIAFLLNEDRPFEQSHNCNMVLNPMSEKKRIYLYIQLKRLILIESFYSALLAEWYTTIYGTQIPMDHQKSKTEEMFYEKEIFISRSFWYTFDDDTC